MVDEGHSSPVDERVTGQKPDRERSLPIERKQCNTLGPL